MEKYSIFNIYKNKIINASNMDDAVSILDTALVSVVDDVEKQLLISLINSDRYTIKMDLNKLTVYLNILNMLNRYGDAETLINDIQKNITDIAQINTFKRLLKTKTHNYNGNNINFKNCPHCNHKNYLECDSSYIICGYGSRGYDWKGCGMDWCFNCGKKLCKSWNHDMLFNKLNRYHDNKCCKSSAHTNNKNYENEYCMCKNEFVNR